MMKIYFCLNTLIFCFLFFTSCHNDDIPELPDSSQAMRDSIELVRTYKEYDVLSTLCDVEAQPDGSWRYTPTYGKILYSTTPTIRYMVVDDLKEAKLHFKAMLAAALDSAETVDITPDDITYHIEGKGSIRFLASSDAKMQIASVKVDFSVVPSLKEIVFIPKERWPYNDISMFRYGAVYKDKKTNFRFVCIADTRYGDGVLITFDGDITELKVKDKVTMTTWKSRADWVNKGAETKIIRTYTDGNKTWDNVYIKGYEGMSSCGSLFITLRKFMYYNEGTSKETYNDAAYKIFVQGVDGSKPLLPYIYNASAKFLAGNGKPVTWQRIPFSYYYYYESRSFMINSSEYTTGYNDRIKDETDWKMGAGKGEYIPSLSVLVDSTYDPDEIGLVQIYP